VSTNVVIANENANWRACGVKVRQAQALLRRQGIDFSWSASEGAGHARELAAAATTEKAETIIVVGGDGTLNEVVNGILTSGRRNVPRIGIIPTGTSNDFSKSLGIPQDPRRACAAIARARVRRVDVGRAGAQYFCSASCLGYFADVAAVSQTMTGLRGSLRYVVAGLTVVRKMSAGWNTEIVADGQTFRGDYAVLLVGNAPRFGGLTMLPGAEVDDGVLDCLLIEMAGKGEALQLIPLLYCQALERHRKVTRFRASCVSVRLDRPSRQCNDGEVRTALVQTIDYAVLPRKLSVLC
jgi:YegS/Rv2252/BmrU family lipid kinase